MVFIATLIFNNPWNIVRATRTRTIWPWIFKLIAVIVRLPKLLSFNQRIGSPPLMFQNEVSWIKWLSDQKIHKLNTKTYYKLGLLWVKKIVCQKNACLYLKKISLKNVWSQKSFYVKKCWVRKRLRLSSIQDRLLVKAFFHMYSSSI